VFVKKFSDNINYLPVSKNVNENVIQHKGSNSKANSVTTHDFLSMKNNVVNPKIKDNNFINKFINK
jgi:hypothetical protein